MHFHLAKRKNRNNKSGRRLMWLDQTAHPRAVGKLTGGKEEQRGGRRGGRGRRGRRTVRRRRRLLLMGWQRHELRHAPAGHVRPIRQARLILQLSKIQSRPFYSGRISVVCLIPMAPDVAASWRPRSPVAGTASSRGSRTGRTARLSSRATVT